MVVYAPNVEKVECTNRDVLANQLHCPEDCGHGKCDEVTKTCKCDEGWSHVDCSECDSLKLCNGHGICKGDGAPTCQCDAGVLGHWAGANCEKCADGWTGENCNGNCGT